MDRILTYEITAALLQQTGSMTVGEFLRSRGYSHRFLALLKRTPGAIKAGGVSIPASLQVSPGMLLQVNVTLPGNAAAAKGYGCAAMSGAALFEKMLVYRDEDLMVINKPAGLAVHPGHDAQPALSDLAAAWMTRQDCPGSFHCIGRLDRDTSGLLLAARHGFSASVLSAAALSGSIEKTYLAIVEGCLTGSGTIDAPIARKEGSALARCVDPVRGAAAVTCYEAVRYLPGHHLTLVRLKLQTGRTHQIRVHMQWTGHPLAGDFLYNPQGDTRLIARQALHAHTLAFTHPVTGALLQFSAPLPSDMLSLADG